MNSFYITHHGNRPVSVRWVNDKGQINRENGPAFENFKGYKQWRRNGALHRYDGPAIIKPNVYEQYWENGILIREIILK